MFVLVWEFYDHCSSREIDGVWSDLCAHLGLSFYCQYIPIVRGFGFGGFERVLFFVSFSEFCEGQRRGSS